MALIPKNFVLPFVGIEALEGDINLWLDCTKKQCSNLFTINFIIHYQPLKIPLDIGMIILGKNEKTWGRRDLQSSFKKSLIFYQILQRLFYMYFCHWEKQRRLCPTIALSEIRMWCNILKCQVIERQNREHFKALSFILKYLFWRKLEVKVFNLLLSNFYSYIYFIYYQPFILN